MGVRGIVRQSCGAPAGSHRGTGLESPQHRKELLSPDAAIGSGLRHYSSLRAGRAEVRVVMPLQIQLSNSR